MLFFWGYHVPNTQKNIFCNVNLLKNKNIIHFKSKLHTYSFNKYLRVLYKPIIYSVLVTVFFFKFIWFSKCSLVVFRNGIFYSGLVSCEFAKLTYYVSAVRAFRFVSWNFLCKQPHHLWIETVLFLPKYAFYFNFLSNWIVQDFQYNVG